MDGAGKFVRGDAVAGLLITFDQHHRRPDGRGPAAEDALRASALSTYVSLTIGDGLVTQVPALSDEHRRRPGRHPRLGGGATGPGAGQRSSSAPSGPSTRRPAMLAFLGHGAGDAPPRLHAHWPAPSPTRGRRLEGRRGPAPAGWRRWRRSQEAERIEVENALPLDLLQVEVGLELVTAHRRRARRPADAPGRRPAPPARLWTLASSFRRCTCATTSSSARRSTVCLLCGNTAGRGERCRPGRLLAIHAPDACRPRCPARAASSRPSACRAAGSSRPTGRGRRPRAARWWTRRRSPPPIMGELLAAQRPRAPRPPRGAGPPRHPRPQLRQGHRGGGAGRRCPMAGLIKVLRNLLQERVSVRDFRTILEALADHAGEHQRRRPAHRAGPPAAQQTADPRPPRRRRPAAGLDVGRVTSSPLFRRMQAAPGGGPSAAVDAAELNRLAESVHPGPPQARRGGARRAAGDLVHCRYSAHRRHLCPPNAAPDQRPEHFVR